MLSGVSLSLQPGEIKFVLGKSGTGKSVLLKCIVGLLSADQGEIWFAGKNVTRLTEEEYLEMRTRCGLVFQQPALLDWMSVFENIKMGLVRDESPLSSIEIEERIRSVLDSVGLQNIEHLRPSQLSFGMQKRVSLARALALRPAALLYDEPTTGLDPIASHQINQLIYSLAKKSASSALVVSHDIHCALEIADEILLLDQGKVIARGSPEQICTHRDPMVSEFLKDIRSFNPWGIPCIQSNP